MLPAYAELHCRSHFSFLSGASSPESLVQRAHALGYTALALTDECSVSGVVRAHTEAVKLGLQLIVGAEMRLTEPEQQAPATRLVVLASSRRGYGNLSQWITVARRRAPKGQYLAYPSDLEGRVPNAPQLAGLPGCLAVWLPQAEPPSDLPDAVGVVAQREGLTAALADLLAPPSWATLLAQAQWLRAWFGPERAAIGLHLRRQPYDDEWRSLVRALSRACGLPVVATGSVLMQSRACKPLQDALTATRLRCTVAQAGWALQANAEAHLRTRQRLATLYPAEWMAQSVRWAQRCQFSLAELRYEYPQELVPEGHTPGTWLRELTERGVRRRFRQGEPAAVRAQIEHELALIAQLAYEPYFLTVADLVHWARLQGILCQGRGSAANSAVCFCLGVTEVDPARTQVLFERFISAERNEPPDIDIDFEHQRREEVIQYIYRKYGRHRAALTGVIISYRSRSAMRDMGRALGFDLDRIEAVSRMRHGFEGPPMSPECLRESGFDPDAPLSQLWVELSRQLRGYPRHLSQHPGGFVIARDSMASLVPVENAAMDKRTVIQWDKDDLDALRLIKVDILALGMLSAIRRALEDVVRKQPERWTPLLQSLVDGAPLSLPMSALPPDDPEVYDMLCDADSIGVFQVESRAQMSMLPRLQPRQFYDLVIEVAIVRPGPIQGGMVHPYLKRRSGEEPVSYPSEDARQALERTLGVPIFQEQVMQLAILAADFTPGEADQLRRAMAAWKRKGGLEPFHERLVGRMVAKGYERDYAEAIFKQIQGFGEYGFPESHAASFALLVYVSAWLKRHHPDAFLAALLNSQPMGFYAPAQLVRDARQHGVQVLPVDVQHSLAETQVLSVAEASAAGITPGSAAPELAPDCASAQVSSTGASEDHGSDGLAWSRHRPAAASLRPVRLGLNRLKGLGDEAAQRIVLARAAGPFDSVEDLARRAALDGRALRLLADGNALRGLAGHRHAAAWAVAGIDAGHSPLLSHTRTAEDQAPVLQAPSAGAALLADYRSTGLSLGQHPLALLRPQLQAFKVLPAALLRHCRPGQLARASGLVTHRQRPETAKGVVFVTLEDETGAVNVIVWPALAQAQHRPLLAARLLTVYGVWQRGAPESGGTAVSAVGTDAVNPRSMGATDKGRADEALAGSGAVYHLIAKKLVDHSALLQGLSTRSRDFH